MKLKTIIIDDEKLALDLLRAMLAEHCPEVDIVGEADNVEIGKELCKKLNPDFILLDIELSGGSGFDILDAFPVKSFQTIFTSAHEAYGIKAIKNKAMYYVLKPISSEDLIEAVKRVAVNLEIENEERMGLSSYEGQRLILPDYKGFKMTGLKDIIRLEASDNYTIIFTANGGKTVVSKTLKEYETNIKNIRFLRVHKSHIININYLKEYISDDGHFALMSDGQKIPVSKLKLPDFFEVVNKYLK